MTIKNTIGIVFITLLLSGCLKHYVYETRSSLPYADESEYAAVIYWGKDEGRLWYGKKVDRLVDSDIEIRICQKIATLTYLPVGDNHVLTLRAAPSDHVAAVDEGIGEIVQLETSRAASRDEVCGRIIVDNRYATIHDLNAGAEPLVTILCENPARPDRYPAVGVYRFETVSRTEGKGQDAPSPCRE